MLGLIFSLGFSLDLTKRMLRLEGWLGSGGEKTE